MGARYGVAADEGRRRRRRRTAHVRRRAVSGPNHSRMTRILGHPDRLSGAVLSLLAVIALVEAAPLPYGTVCAPDAGFFAKTLAALLLFFGLGILFNLFLCKGSIVLFT